ncbi:hypothetical protein [Bradyrhizobium sp. LMG 9283]|uniref:hypothetical protein n=1 Tax=Bradyrhizobium sp. LMG 9283 TaxID=592064 RepID=UPI003890B3F4
MLHVQKPGAPSLRHGSFRQIEGVFGTGFFAARPVAQEINPVVAIQALKLAAKLARFRGVAKALEGLVAVGQIAFALGRSLESVKHLTVTRKEIDDVEPE